LKLILIGATGVRDLAFLSYSLSEVLNPVRTLGGLMAILFDTGIVIVTILKTLTILRLKKGLKTLERQSLVSLLIQQGEHHSLLVVEILLNLNKVWSDMGNSACLPPFMYLTIVQICAYGDSC